jgi:hypothetical protein
MIIGPPPKFHGTRDILPGPAIAVAVILLMTLPPSPMISELTRSQPGLHPVRRGQP